MPHRTTTTDRHTSRPTAPDDPAPSADTSIRQEHENLVTELGIQTSLGARDVLTRPVVVVELFEFA